MNMLRPSMVWLLVLALAVAPVAPAVASFAHGAAGGHAGHASMDHGHHAPAPADAADGGLANNDGCAKHAACDGQCCGACAQCFTAAVTFSPAATTYHTVQTPVIPRLHARLGMSLPDRPPQSLC